MTPPLHPAVEHLAGLLGTWRGRGRGAYPTIQGFSYTEEVVFSHVGKPFLTYVQRTRDAETGVPLHTETGYLRPGADGTLECLFVQPTGIVEMHEGTFDGRELRISTNEVVLTKTAKLVSAVERTMTFESDTCSYVVLMAAVGEPMSVHLEAQLLRSPD